MARRPALLPDEKERAEAVRERRRNVVIDAGAGTGKTTTVVARLVEMLAPANDADPAIPLQRIAAVTFTRRAAGELRLRMRQVLLRALGDSKNSLVRGRRLSEALGELDAAYVGTIHSFADRLLRLRPAEARISPAYEIAEDADEYVRETYERLMHAVERGSLEDELYGEPAADHAEIAEDALRAALNVGLRAESLETEFYTQFGLDAVVAGFIDSRDVDVPTEPPLALDLRRLRKGMRTFIEAMDGANPETEAGARLVALADGFAELLDEDDAEQLYAEIVQLLERHASGDNWGKKDDFLDDEVGFQAWKLLDKKTAKRPSLRSELMETLGAWLGSRLLHVRPVAIALYDKVKRRHQVADNLDLLIKLRDLMRDDRESRGFYQQRFDHIFVDEFQDTDPLQAEIVAYLAERSPSASDWRAVKLAPGKLTIVGDPKQSIYRFRRADVELYETARGLIAGGPQVCLKVELQANFRSREPLVRWFNDRFDKALGVDPERRFDPEKGAVFNRHLAAGRTGKFPPSVHVVPYDLEGGKGGADDYRQLEGEAMSHYLKWLVNESGLQIQDPVSSKSRAVGYGDIAILCLSTTKLGYLFPRLDALCIPHAARGATLFLSDPLHRQFLLGLRALADRDDGIAQAALLRPPFFAIDPRDLALEQAHRAAPQTTALCEAVARVTAARELVTELRCERFARSPGTTARDLLQRTAIGATIAVGPNGLARLERLRELCLILGQRAIEGRLDYDAVTASMREWVEHPVQLDPPHPVGGDAVQIMTVHQAKGLEFPVVVFWDGCAKWGDIERSVPFRTGRDRGAWAMYLYRLQAEMPRDSGLKAREGRYRESERARLVYVLGTRARDLLVLPRAGEHTKDWIAPQLGADPPAGTTLELPMYRGGAGAKPCWWEHGPDPVPSVVPGALAADRAARWGAAFGRVATGRFAPLPVSVYAHAAGDEPGGAAIEVGVEAERDDVLIGAEPEERPSKPLKRREGRYGSTFGITVHRALELRLLGHRDSSRAALEGALAESGLDHHLDEALADVERALATLQSEKLLPEHGRKIALEYPIVGSSPGGEHMLLGIIDFVSVDTGVVDVIDFKTDRAPGGDVAETHAGYVRQARCYGELLGKAGLRVGRAGLLFTGETRVRWLPLR
jgi:ATP-dependent helicase/nuclease subunit A